jgi:hypothetical protein
MRKFKLRMDTLAVVSFAPAESVALAAGGTSEMTGCRDCTYEPICPSGGGDCPPGGTVITQ